MSRLQILLKHGFTIYQNFWTWNAFHFCLKLSQRAAVYYAVSVFLENIWMCIGGNQTIARIASALPALEDYLELLVTEKSDWELELSDKDQASEHSK